MIAAAGLGQTRTSSLGAARPLPPSAAIGPGGQSVSQAAQFCLGRGLNPLTSTHPRARKFRPHFRAALACATARPQLAKADTAFQGASVGQPTEPCLQNCAAWPTDCHPGPMSALGGSGRAAPKEEVRADFGPADAMFLNGTAGTGPVSALSGQF